MKCLYLTTRSLDPVAGVQRLDGSGRTPGRELGESGFGGGFGGGGVDRAHVMADLVPILPRRVPEGVADQVDDALLDRGELPDGVDRVREALQAVADRDAHVLNAAVLQLGQYLQPELRTLRPVTGPQTQDVAFSVDGDPDDHIDGFVADLPSRTLTTMASMKITG